MRLEIDKIVECIKLLEKYVHHRGFSPQSLPCCSAHVLICEAKEELQKIEARNTFEEVNSSYNSQITPCSSQVGRSVVCRGGLPFRNSVESSNGTA